MPKNSFIFNSKKLPWGFIGMLMVFCVSQFWLVHSRAFWEFCNFYSNPSSGDALRVEAQLRLMKYSPSVKKVFLIGSSQVREGFDVEVINEKFKEQGIVFYNLGTSGYGSPFEILLMKDELLAQKPDIIVYVPYVGSLYPDGDYEFSNIMKFHFKPELFSYLNRTLGWRELLDHRVGIAFLDYCLGKISVLFTYRDPLQRAIFNALNDKMGIEKRPEPVRFAYTETAPIHHFILGMARDKGDKYKDNQFAQLNKELFPVMVREFESRDIKLIVLSAPAHPLMPKTYKPEIAVAYEEFLSQQSREYNFQYLPQSVLPPFAHTDFVDFTHLSPKGRVKFTGFVNKVFMQIL